MLNKLSYKQKARLLILLGVIGLFLPVIPGVVLILLGFALLADKKSRLDVDVRKLVQEAKKVKSKAAKNIEALKEEDAENV